MATAGSPKALLVDVNGNPIIFEDGATIPAGTDAVLLAGRDGTTARQLRANASGQLRTQLDNWIGSTAPSVGQKTMAASIPVAIASDQTSVPGGIQSLVDDSKMFSASLQENAASAGTDNPMMLIDNPGGSGKNIYLWKVQGGITVANNNCIFKMFANPTVTVNGTAITRVQRQIGSGTASVVNAFKLPTVSANGSVLSQLVEGENQNALIFASDFSLRINPGNKIMITAKPGSNNRQTVITAIWLEESV